MNRMSRSLAVLLALALFVSALAAPGKYSKKKHKKEEDYEDDYDDDDDDDEPTIYGRAKSGKDGTSIGVLSGGKFGPGALSKGHGGNSRYGDGGHGGNSGNIQYGGHGDGGHTGYGD